MTASAVAGAKAGNPAASRPRLRGLAPSMSLAGAIADVDGLAMRADKVTAAIRDQLTR